MRSSLLARLSGVFHVLADRLDSMAPRENFNGASEVILNEYVDSVPSVQNAIDSIPGWNGALPPPLEVTAGAAPLFADGRIHWALEQYGSIEGKSLLELGPMEGSHTYILNGQRPASIVAIEANRLAFLRCLLVKDLLDLDRAHFMLGNFVKWLEVTDQHYDFVVASGVLYHMQDPLNLIALMAQRTNAFYLWTHYASDVSMPEGDVRRLAFVGEPETKDYRGIPVRLYRRRYHGAWRSSAFCGGMYDLHSWIEREDLIKVIRESGFDDIRIADDEPQHMNGPSFSIFARRTMT